MALVTRSTPDQQEFALDATAAPGPDPVTARDPWAPLGLTVAAVLVAVLFALPVGFLVWQTAALGLSAVWSTITADALGPLARSLLLGTCVSVSTATVGVGMAWVTTRTDLPGRRLWALLAPVPLVIPSYVGAAALVAGFASGGLFADLAPQALVERLPVSGFWGSWFVLTALSYPYVYLPVAARLSALSPSFEESARLLGRRPRQVFVSVVLPQARTAVAAGALLVFLYTISDFGAVSIMRYPTLTNELFQSKLVPSVWLPLSSLLALVALVIVASERRAARRQTRTQSVRNARPMQVRLGRWRWPTFAAVSGVMFASLAAPLLVLGAWAVRAFTTSSPSGSVQVGTSTGALVRPALNTVAVSLAAAVVTVLLVLPVAYLSSRYRSRVGGSTSTVVVAAFALPGLVIALALIFATLRTSAFAWLYQSIALLVFAYVVHFGAQALRASQVAVGTVPRRFDEVARTLGASRFRRLVTVDLPLMRPGLLAGGGLVLLSAMKELPATLLLAPPNFQTLATHIWSASESHYLGQLATASMLLVAISAGLTWFLVIRRARWLD